jgi:hypothetical protein
MQKSAPDNRSLIFYSPDTYGGYNDQRPTAKVQGILKFELVGIGARCFPGH